MTIDITKSWSITIDVPITKEMQECLNEKKEISQHDFSGINREILCDYVWCDRCRKWNTSTLIDVKNGE